MATTSSHQNGFADLPRAVLSAAVGVIDTVERVVVGERRVRSARRNAWEAICADRAREDHRAEVRRQVATITMSLGPIEAPLVDLPRVEAVEPLLATPLLPTPTPAGFVATPEPALT